MSDGLIFDIQHYAVHDGPGIRTLVFFKGCPLRCLWCCNPESQDPGPELRHVRMRCKACGTCAEACAEGAIARTDGGILIDRRPCGSCSGWRCVEACPRGALSKVGAVVTAEEVASRIALDAAFYENSGGGVTFSGGEPFGQPAFLEDLLLRCRGLGIHAAVETCGLAPAETLLGLEPLIGLLLYDLKAVDPQLHRRCTGASNEVILENLRSLAGRCAGKITVRVPLVPGYTDSEDNLAAIAALASGLGIRSAELMPYHELGRDKYEGLGRDYPLAVEGPQPRPEHLEASLRIFRERGLACEAGGA